MWQRRLQRELRVLAALLTLVFAGLSLSGATGRLDNLLYDAVLRAGSRPTPDRLIIVAIDDASIAALGPWPWPRRVHAALLDRLAPAQPQAIVYDVLFTDPARDPADDAALAAALRRAPVVLPAAFAVPGTNGAAYDVRPPVPVLAAAARVGEADIVPDDDGVVRGIARTVDGAARWPHVAVLAAGAAARLPAFAARPPTAPLRRVAPVLIGFGGGPGHIRAVPFVAVLRGEVPAAFFAGATVLVGATAPGLGDRYSVPTGGRDGVMAGVEIQANVVDALRSGHVVAVAPAWAAALAGVTFLAALLWRLPRVQAGWSGPALALLALVASAALLRAGVWLAPASLTLTLLLAELLWAWRRSSAVGRYMLDELGALGAEPDLLLPAAAARRGGDSVGRQIELLHATVARVRTLRRLAQTAVLSLPDPTLMVGRDGAVVLANTEARRLFGATIAAADVDAAFAGAGLPAFGRAALADPAQPWQVECAALDGSIREIRPVVWRDDHGAPLGWVVRFADVSALRRAERSREEALQLLTHDMRAPQASILALLARHGGDVPAALGARLGHYARRTVALADGFLHLARADARAYARVPVDLAAILTEAVDDLWPQLLEKRIALTLAGADVEQLVAGEAGLLFRALVNVIGNAVKFSPAGGAIRCAIGGERTHVVVTVADDGPGMSRDVVAGLFGRFRHHGGRDGRVDGVGLGLAFVDSVVRGHDGTVTCVSAPGAGATFTLALPRVAAP